ncbi:hypothetical protein K458DRAFT_154914 [Lentithecium fluviatile CBS 122367]|uniref:Uncharacterized protein n=1 Tax=Lentithecium fluviatile CBS 122367 TaxID=1168545 RepID=A0A6G1JFP3_9PLEO|nr:hypothetical protein K458DRAFT_154914 [Lentithecium fluviatile CBS 122367]
MLADSAAIQHTRLDCHVTRQASTHSLPARAPFGLPSVASSRRNWQRFCTPSLICPQPPRDIHIDGATHIASALHHLSSPVTGCLRQRDWPDFQPTACAGRLSSRCLSGQEGTLGQEDPNCLHDGSTNHQPATVQFAIPQHLIHQLRPTTSWIKPDISEWPTIYLLLSIVFETLYNVSSAHTTVAIPVSDPRGRLGSTVEAAVHLHPRCWPTTHHPRLRGSM